MFEQKRFSGPVLRLTACVSLALALMACASLSAAEPVATTTPEMVPSKANMSESERLVGYAELGAFDRVLEEIKKTTPSTGAGKKEAALVTDIERFRGQQVEYAKARKESYDKAIARLKKMDEAGRYDDALVAAIEAHTIAEDPNELFKNDDVAKAVKGAKDAAAKAVAAGNWLDALNFYRLLDALFDDHASFREPLADASQHARILRLYAPDEYEKQLRARVAKLKEKRKADAATAAAEKVKLAKGSQPGTVPEPALGATTKPANDDDLDSIRMEKEPWQKTLDGVDPAMVRQVFDTAARLHIENKHHYPLIAGAIKSLSNLVNEPSMKDAFPGLADPEKVSEFLKAMDQVNTRLLATGPDLTKAQAYGMVEDLLKANRNSIQLPEQVMVYEMTEGGLQNLDEFSSVIWPREKDMFDRTLKGKFYGVGILISKKDDRILVVTPLEDSPALKAGIKAGDVIAKVDGQDTLGWSLDEVVRRITGKKGTEVVLTIDRKGSAEPLVFKLIRDEIPLESVRGWERRPKNKGGWNYWIDPENRIAYIRLSQFIGSSARDIDLAVESMQASGPINGLIFDLRGNPGGLLNSAFEIANRFIPAGAIVSTVGNDGVKTQEFKAQAQKTYAYFPVVVLVDQGSASASEIVSGALQDYRRALIVGSRSYGKGSVQDVMPFDGDKWMLKLTTQYYMLPKGRIIHRKPESRTWGVDPDLKVSVTPEQATKAFELRQEADIVDAGADPATLPSTQPGPDGTVVERPKVSDLVTKGLDPQLVAALLILKTQVYADTLPKTPAAGKAANVPAEAGK
jgi:carboxyl-terminal processing protease